ncbi:MAG: leucine-rich repeat protein [Duncaniella sp.]|nr:leucine-rich repeat protein [Duncaniella sp.]
MKKIILLLLTIISGLSASSANPIIEYDGIRYILYEPADGLPGTAAVYKNPSASGDVIIPDTVYTSGKQYIVDAIYGEAFTGSSITSISLPKTLNYIYQRAFSRCNSLTSVVIPDSVIGIGLSAFTHCSKLESVKIGKSVSLIEEAFYGCSALEEFIIDEDNPNFICVDDIVYSKDMSSVNMCLPSKKGEIALPNSVQTIGSHAFFGCSGLTSITIPNSVQTIGGTAFFGCSGLTSITIPSGVTTIGEYAFCGCSSLTSITIPNSVQTIGGSAFSGCSGLTSITIPSGVTTIGEYAFYGCSGLTSMTIPNTVTTIECYTFGDCSSLKELTIQDGETPLVVVGNYYKEFDGYMFSTSPLEKLHYGRNLETGNRPLPFKDKKILKSLSIGDSIKSIADSVFSGCNNLVSLNIGKSVETIGISAFSDCTKLESLKIGESVETIGKSAFSGCSSLTSLVIPDSVRTIGELAFLNCGALTSVCLGKSVETIGISAFSDCTKLESLKIGESVETIGESAFSGCSSLTSLVIPDSVRTIGESAFSSCGALTSVCLGKSVESIGYKAFYCYDTNMGYQYPIDSKITEIKVLNPVPPLMEYSVWNSNTYSDAVLEVPEGTILDYILTDWNNFKSINAGGVDMSHTSIDDGIFRYRLVNDDPEKPAAILAGVVSKGITSATIPERVTDMSDPDNPRRYYVKVIGPEAFSGCSWLKELTINPRASIEIICRGAFKDCTALESVEIPESVQSIEAKAFYGSGLRSVSIPAAVMTVGDEAFAACKSLTELRIEDSTEPISFGQYVFGYYNYISTPDTRARLSSMYIGRDWDGNVTGYPGVLKTLVIGNLVKVIPDGRFSVCSNLASLTLGSGLESIESYAFHGAGMLHEVVIPSSVRSIGAYAFSNNNLKSVIIGCGVEAIGENAFAGSANVESVAITAQKPPTAPYTAFSDYSAKLYLQGGQDVIDAYYDAYTCWDRFTGYSMTVARRIDGDGETSISGEPGDRIQLSAKVWPADATLPQIFWRSTNPAVATVDNNGLVTVRKGADEGGCRIIASTLYADGPELVYGVNGSDESGIDVPVADVVVDGPVEVYSINGIRLGDSTEGLAPGIYIVRRGSSVTKVLVK